MTHSMTQRFGHITLMMLAVITIGIGVRGNRALAQDSAQSFEVTVTNLTQGQRFTPILVATHKQGLKLFELGRASSPQLEILAEDGDTAPLTALLLGMPEVLDVTDSGSLLPMGLLSPVVP